MESEIIVLEERLAKVKTELDTRIRLLDGALEEEDESTSNTATVKLGISNYHSPTAPTITDESFFYLPPPNLTYNQLNRSSFENETYTSEELCTHRKNSSVERNANRLSLNVDIMRPAPRYFPLKQQQDQNMPNLS